MTVVCFDGKTMAADRQGEFYCTKTSRKKIRRVGDLLVGGSGEARASEALIQWLANGADVDNFPRFAEGDKADVLVASKDGLRLFQSSPYPMVLENKFFAIGSGCDAAMAAMHLGLDARRAVEVACVVCTGCGGGIDAIDLED